MKCKHSNTTSEFLADGTTARKWLYCDDCNKPLSLGPSNDDSPAVQVEMRAAESYAKGNDPEPPFSNVPFMALFGFANHSKQLDSVSAWPPRHRSGVDWWSGWLLRELATHDDRETRDANAWAWDLSRPLAEQLAETARDDAAADAMVDDGQPRCDFHEEHDADGRPVGRRCEATATHRLVWLDGSNRYSYGCSDHLILDPEATPVRAEALP